MIRCFSAGGGASSGTAYARSATVRSDSRTVSVHRSQLRQVHGEARLVVRLERGQRPADGERVPLAVVAGVLVAEVPARLGRAAHGRAPSASATPSSRSRSRRMPASIRVFTVPSGVFVRSAISRWV